MEPRQAYYIQKLREGLLARQQLNPQFSIRAYARDLGIHSSTLSQILLGKRSIPSKISKDLALRLKLSPKEQTLFIESINRSGLTLDQIKISPLDERFMLDESYHKVLAEWEHYALLELFELDDFEPSLSYMASKLKVSESRMEAVITNLLTCGLLVKDSKGLLKKAHPDIRTTEDMKGEALNHAHFEELELAQEKLQEIDKELRDFSSSTLAMDIEKLDEAKTIIREFRQKMNALLKNGNKKDVYLLAIQFFPLTDPTRDRKFSPESPSDS